MDIKSFVLKKAHEAKEGGDLLSPGLIIFLNLLKYAF